MNDHFASWKFKDEPECVDRLLEVLSADDGPTSAEARARLIQQRRVWIDGAGTHQGLSSLHRMIEGFALERHESLALIAMAGALLHKQNTASLDALLQDRLSDEDFERLFGQSGDWLGRISSFGLKMSYTLLGEETRRKLGMAVVRRGAIEGMRAIADAFVLAPSIEEALAKANSAPRGIGWNFAMPVESARTEFEAETNFNAYTHTISTLGRSVVEKGSNPLNRHGVMIRLSALHPRLCAAQARTCVPALAERLAELCRIAAAANINLTLEAERVAHMHIGLQVAQRSLQAPYLKGWNGFGMSVQAYDKRALAFTQELISWAAEEKRRICIHLNKGSYWDQEIKYAQEAGLPAYPVFTRKCHTDVSFLACAQTLMDNRHLVVPYFATHNISTAANVLDMAGEARKNFAFESLYGMGQGLHGQIASMDVPCALYAPVGTHGQLVSYIVRRLIENGAKNSFVRRFADESYPRERLIEDPIAAAHASGGAPSAHIAALGGGACAYDFDEITSIKTLEIAARTSYAKKVFEVPSLIEGAAAKGHLPETLSTPAAHGQSYGHLWPADSTIVSAAFASVVRGMRAWQNTDIERRAHILEAIADRLEDARDELVGLCTLEAGKTLRDGLSEVRKASQHCRVFAQQARMLFAQQITLPNISGEQHILDLAGRGVFACISPWNLPLSSFVKQIAAALVAGNVVVAKPATQTPLIALRAVQIMLEAGVPKNALALVQGDGRVGEMILAHRHVGGAAFTGSYGTAKAVHKNIADRNGPIVPLIADSAGLNAMVADGTALPAQLCDDAMHAAFSSAGQRCSALRLLCVHEDIADDVCDKLAGALDALVVGLPWLASTDIGPLIDAQALANIQRHKSGLRGGARVIAEGRVEEALTKDGYYIAPMIAEISSIDDIKRDVFGPVLHVLRYKTQERDSLIEAINHKGIALNFAAHSRIESCQDEMAHMAQAAHIYINKSSVGSKGHSPYYLLQFVREKFVCTDMQAAGANLDLLNLDE